ncbi:hypothetical protein [Natronococcus roseus]|uniref:hypothetical protein n=1 Tax=Natronococcus roseus TaxID=1052014 RepID=UPI00374DDC17
MNHIKMTAGALSVEVSGGEDASPAELAEICRDLQEWQMRQTSEVNGAYVELKPKGFVGEW